jgi:hypothetical protein
MRTKNLLFAALFGFVLPAIAQVEHRILYTDDYDAALMVEPTRSTPKSKVTALYLRCNEKKVCRLVDEPSLSHDGLLIAYQEAPSNQVCIIHTKLHVSKVVLKEYRGTVRFFNWTAKRGYLRLEYDDKQFVDVQLPDFGATKSPKANP